MKTQVGGGGWLEITQQLLFLNTGTWLGHHTTRGTTARIVKRTLTKELPNSVVNGKNVHGFKGKK